jgi:hypothetical protein
VDCLVRADSADSARGVVSVLEFKTGHPGVHDREQTILYRLAVESTFSDALVDAWLVYRDHVEQV